MTQQQPKAQESMGRCEACNSLTYIGKALFAPAEQKTGAMQVYCATLACLSVAVARAEREDMTSNRRRWDGTASWLPTPKQQAAANLERADERHRLARRIDDGPLTVLHKEGYGKTPGHDKPVPKWLRMWRRLRIAVKDRLSSR